MYICTAIFNTYNTCIDIFARSFTGNFVCLFAFENNFYDVPCSASSSSSSHATFAILKIGDLENWKSA